MCFSWSGRGQAGHDDATGARSFSHVAPHRDKRRRERSRGASAQASRQAAADADESGVAPGVTALPASPEAVAAFVASAADRGRAVSTLEQRLAAIRWAHEAKGYEARSRAPDFMQPVTR